jgi:NADPH:quinone reductase-like Zn-dependent oxidoreductase
LTKVGADLDRNVLITGIGGGVALMALTIVKAAGANVWVTSGDEAKIEKAVELGATGGVSYKEEGWEKKLLGMLPMENKRFDAIIDGAGAGIVGKAVKLLKVMSYFRYVTRGVDDANFDCVRMEGYYPSTA